MKVNGRESGGGLQRWSERLRLWISEIRLRFDLRYSKDFKKLCEERGCPNLANLEDGYIHQVQGKIVSLQEQRAALKETPQETSAAKDDFTFRERETKPSFSSNNTPEHNGTKTKSKGAL